MSHEIKKEKKKCANSLLGLSSHEFGNIYTGKAINKQHVLTKGGGATSQKSRKLRAWVGKTQNDNIMKGEI